jgi:hypothetical protein
MADKSISYGRSRSVTAQELACERRSLRVATTGAWDHRPSRSSRDAQRLLRRGSRQCAGPRRRVAMSNPAPIRVLGSPSEAARGATRGPLGWVHESYSVPSKLSISGVYGHFRALRGLPRHFNKPDKEEVPGSNPGSPISPSPAVAGVSCFWGRRYALEMFVVEALWKPREAGCRSACIRKVRRLSSRQ